MSVSLGRKSGFRTLWWTVLDWPTEICLHESQSKRCGIRSYKRGSPEMTRLANFQQILRARGTYPSLVTYGGFHNLLTFRGFVDSRDGFYHTVSDHVIVRLEEICSPISEISRLITHNDCVSIIHQLLNGILSLLNGIGLQHNELSMKNIFITSDGILKIGCLHETSQIKSNCGVITLKAISSIADGLSKYCGEICSLCPINKVSLCPIKKISEYATNNDSTELSNEAFIEFLKGIKTEESHVNSNRIGRIKLGALAEISLMRKFRPINFGLMPHQNAALPKPEKGAMRRIEKVPGVRGFVRTRHRRKIYSARKSCRSSRGRKKPRP